MSRTVSSFLGAILCLTMTSFAASGAESLSDAQAAHFLSAAQQSNMDAANLALSSSSNGLVRAFASETSRSHTAFRQKNATMLSRLNVASNESDYSRTLAGGALQRQQELYKLSGPAFDKAYAKNELFYNLLVIGVLEARLIPSAKNTELKTVLQSALAVFKDRQEKARSLTLMLHQSTSGNR